MLLRDGLTENKDIGREWSRMRNCGLLVLVLALLAMPGAQVAEASEDHAFDVRFNSHLRYEYWDARAPEAENFVASRSRLGLKYDWRNAFSLFGEGQFALVSGLSENRQRGRQPLSRRHEGRQGRYEQRLEGHAVMAGGEVGNRPGAAGAADHQHGHPDDVS